MARELAPGGSRSAEGDALCGDGELLVVDGYNVIHKSVGQISENDVTLAAASEAVIVGFQVRPSQAARKLADKEGVEIRQYSVIYDAIDDVRQAMEGMLKPIVKDVKIPLNLPVKNALNVIPKAQITHCIMRRVIPIFDFSPSTKNGV